MFSSYAILGAILLVPFFMEQIFNFLKRIRIILAPFFPKLFFIVLFLLCVIASYSQIEFRTVVIDDVVVTKEIVCAKLPQTKDEYSTSLTFLFSNLTFVSKEEASMYTNYMLILLQQFGYPENLGERFATIVEDTNYFLTLHHGN